MMRDVEDAVPYDDFSGICHGNKNVYWVPKAHGGKGAGRARQKNKEDNLK